MRADARPKGLAPIAIGAALVATALAGGCRSATARTTAGPHPTLQAVVASAETAELAALPEGTAKTLVSERCLMCHSAALITQQRKDAAAWGRTLTQMRTWGAPIQDEDQAALVSYLVEHFGAAAARP
jgi:cytochrome c5